MVSPVSIDELSSAIGDGTSKVGESSAVVAGAKAQADELTATFAGLNADGQSAAMSGVSAQLDEAAALLDAASQKLDEAQQSTEAARQSGLQHGGSTGPGPPVAPDRPSLPGFARIRPHPTAIEALRRHGWPKNSAGRTSARGQLYDAEGRRIDGVDVMKAHRKGEVPPCDDLKEPWRSDPEYTTTWHAERDAAKIMRDRGLPEAVLYLNIPPCGGRDRDEKRCDANLRKIIPEGSNLWVWTIRENSAPRLRRHEGTGEAIT